MDLLELEHFQKIAELGSLSKVSATLGISQSTLTRQLKKLGEAFGAPLFYRHGRGMVLTPAGQKLLAGSKEILADLARLRSEIASDSAEPSGRVSLGLPPSFCAAIGADLTEAFGAACPNASLRIHELFSATLPEWVASARLDLAVLYDVRRQANLHISPLLEEDLFLIQAADGPGARDPIPFAELVAEPLILPCGSNGLRRVIQAAAARAGATVNVVADLDSTTVMKQLVERRYAATILPYGAVWREVDDGRLQARPIVAPAPTALLVLTTPLLQPISTASRVLADLLTVQVSRCVQNGVLRGRPHRPSRSSGLSRSKDLPE